ncbi:hypothetical protein [Streptomyces sp. NBC_01716]|uniref:hypothetical protein n=1 Tax=Streptomyces sp. NBC_01716 TaxID=2975917 RepID=UPI002E314070|nr:hypothetical protein [Streptomyces sp. NBC_01716]
MAAPDPVKLRADKAYFSAEHLAWLRERGLVARIARPGIEPGERHGRHHWKTERPTAWLFGYRRLTVRYERKGSHLLAFPGLAAALTCYKKLVSLSGYAFADGRQETAPKDWIVAPRPCQPTTSRKTPGQTVR